MQKNPLPVEGVNLIPEGMTPQVSKPKVDFLLCLCFATRVHYAQDHNGGLRLTPKLIATLPAILDGGKQKPDCVWSLKITSFEMPYKIPAQRATVVIMCGEFFAAVRGDGLTYTVLSLERGEVELGHEIQGELSIGGQQELLNVTTKEKITATVEDWGGTRETSIVRLRNFRPKDEMKFDTLFKPK